MVGVKPRGPIHALGQPELVIQASAGNTLSVAIKMRHLAQENRGQTRPLRLPTQRAVICGSLR